MSTLLGVEERFSQEQVREFKDGETVFAEGDTGRELFIVQSGAVVVRKRAAAGELTLSRFERGEFFGDLGLLQGIPRFASAYAVGPTRLLVLQPGGFLLKLRRDPTFAFEMIQQLSLRVKTSSEKFLEVLGRANVPQSVVDSVFRDHSS